MKFIEVEGLPAPRKYNSLKSDLQEFLGTNILCAKVNFGREYVNQYSCANALRMSIKRSGFPIKVNIRHYEVYLTRTDM